MTAIHGNTGSRTSAALLARLHQRPADQAAWAEFVDRYGPKVNTWCRHWCLQEADARDEIVRLAAKMRGQGRM
jgi:hypothetical protein